VLGVGYSLIHSLLRGEMIGAALLGLLLGKALVWSISLGSGTSGGVLAPLLIMGGALGAFVGHWIHVGDTGLWAMVGMAAMMGGTMRSPLTGMVFLLELTHDFNALPALLIGCVVALGVTVLLMRRSILTEKLARRGHHISREYSVDFFELMRVAEVMDSNPPTVPAAMTVGELSNRLAQGDSELSRRQGTLLLDEQNRLAGIVTRGDLLRALQQDPSGERQVLDAGSAKLIVAYPDELLHDAIARMIKHNIGRLPVVRRDDPKRVVGYFGRACVMTARSRYMQEEELRERAKLGDLLPVRT
jgi:CBS domain-containing protein